jgi:hypothetical protein
MERKYWIGKDWSTDATLRTVCVRRGRGKLGILDRALGLERAPESPDVDFITLHDACCGIVPKFRDR